jgi:cytoskeletal protein CcmA (bactofilin family)
MAREQRKEGPVREMSDVVSVIGPGMEIVGDIKCDGTVKVEGKVNGSIRASKSVVVGEGGEVEGDIETQDVVVAGAVTGTVTGASRVELQDTCRVEGDIRSRRVKLDEGGRLDGRLLMGTDAAKTVSSERLAGKAEKRAMPAAEPAPNLSAAASKYEPPPSTARRS